MLPYECDPVRYMDDQTRLRELFNISLLRLASSMKFFANLLSFARLCTLLSMGLGDTSRTIYSER
jgi:hypothetical protein